MLRPFIKYATPEIRGRLLSSPKDFGPEQPVPGGVLEGISWDELGWYVCYGDQSKSPGHYPPFRGANYSYQLVGGQAFALPAIREELYDEDYASPNIPLDYYDIIGCIKDDRGNVVLQRDDGHSLRLWGDGDGSSDWPGVVDWFRLVGTLFTARVIIFGGG